MKEKITKQTKNIFFKVPTKLLFKQIVVDLSALTDVMCNMCVSRLFEKSFLRTFVNVYCGRFFEKDQFHVLIFFP